METPEKIRWIGPCQISLDTRRRYFDYEERYGRKALELQSEKSVVN
jgi:hypothetical protein